LIGEGRGLMLHEPDLQVCRTPTCVRMPEYLVT
jgi:hypothetical protein